MGGDHVHVRKRVVVALLGAVAAAVMAMPGTAQAAPAPVVHVTPNNTGIVRIQSQGDTSMCLQPTSPDPNVPVVQAQCDGTAIQNWQFVQLGSDPTYKFVNQASGTQCLWAFGNGDAGAPVGVEPCRNPPASNQQFNSGLTLPDSVFLESLIGFRHTGQCVTVPPGQVGVVGTQMQIRPCRPPNVSLEGWNLF
jgi:hypothetical protein